MTMLKALLDAVNAIDTTWTATQKSTFDKIFAEKSISLANGITSIAEFQALVDNVLFAKDINDADQDVQKQDW